MIIFWGKALYKKLILVADGKSIVSTENVKPMMVNGKQCNLDSLNGSICVLEKLTHEKEDPAIWGLLFESVVIKKRLVKA